MHKIIIACKNISKIHQDGNLKIEAIKDLSLTVAAEESIAIMGSSGSGKSTLLQLMGGLDYQTSGSIKIMGGEISQMTQSEIGLWRNKNLGFIYQFYHLLPEFTALENAMIPLLIAKVPVNIAREQAFLVLQKVNLEHRINHKPNELSGGERQRVSVARSIINNPVCILADEPTGNLDTRNAHNIIELLTDLKKQLKLACVVATHDESLITYFDKVFMMSDGRLNPAT